MRRVLIAGLATVALIGCGSSKESSANEQAPVESKAETKAESKAPTEPEPAAALKLPTTETLRTTIQQLSSDDFAGRRPGTEGGRKAVQYIETQMKALGLEPGGDGGTFRQQVTMRATTLELAGATFEVSGRGPTSPLTPLREIVVTSRLASGRHLGLEELVFAGYGITAPEYEWDDYAGVDVAGKYVVVLVGDPPVTDGRFGGDAMTYYGRWTYKFARARELGALGCLVVHETEPASYGWEVVEASWSGERYGLAPGPDDPPPLLLQGWIHGDAADALAKRVDSSLQQWHTDALRPGFVATPLGIDLLAKFEVTDRSIESDNVIGKLTGTERAAEAIAITAHWDHLGTGEPIDGDAIFNGAVDNASGIAGMLATAASLVEYASAGKGPQRSVLFIATTAEEQGLLGSRHFVAHPTVPLDRIVAAVNLDSMNVAGRTRSVVVVGAGQSTLEDTLAEVVQAQGRRTIPDGSPGSGGYYRSDHFAFALRGVPALYFRGSSDMEEGGEKAGKPIAKLRAERYHTVHDEYDPSWSLEGTLQDVEAMTQLVLRVANAEHPPAWKPASEFAERDG